MKYPTEIMMSDGSSAIIIPGHNLPKDKIISGVKEWDPGFLPVSDGENLVIEENYYWYRPRIKWCSRHIGYGCDSEGDWHGHWEPTISRDIENEFTLIYIEEA